MFCIVAIFKNEAEILEEWLAHYLREGCARFFLIDNGSTDAYAPALRPFADRVELVVDATPHAQAALYNQHFLRKARAYPWTVVCDLDEFIYARDKYSTIAAYLQSLESDITQVAVPWKLFGSNGFNTAARPEPPSVIESFTKRTNYDKETGFQGVQRVHGAFKLNLCKSIYRSSAIGTLDIHRAPVTRGRTIQSNGREVPAPGPFVPMNETTLIESQLHLNHYAIRSLDWFVRIKMTRGDVSNIQNDTIRTRDYFKAYDAVSNDIEDDELRNKPKNVAP